MKKDYLGDGVYVEYDGVNFMLTTENGIEVTNTIYLEREQIKTLGDLLMQLPVSVDE